MQAWKIRTGDKLALKKDNPYGFSSEDPWEVREIVTRSGYKTPWLRCSDGTTTGSFRPSDFARHVEVPSDWIERL